MLSFKQKTAGSKILPFAFISSAIVIISYALSIFSSEYFMCSLYSAIYFVAIDWTLVLFFYYATLMVGRDEHPVFKAISRIFTVYAVADTAIELINPFYEISIRYIPLASKIVHFGYDKMFLYDVHLVMSYVMVAGVLLLYTYKSLSVPFEYRNQYRLVVFGMLLIVGINALFLFMPGDEIYNLLDTSIICYSVVAYFVYYSAFKYVDGFLLKDLSQGIVQKSNQGVILFDYDDRLILLNEKISEIMKNFDLQRFSSLSEFLHKTGISEKILEKENYSFQYNLNSSDVLRCDHTMLLNRSGKKLGHLFTFIDVSKETDILTGFHNLNDFKDYYHKNRQRFTAPCVVVEFDTNNLAAINTSLGKDIGDKKVIELSELMRKYLPEDTYFIRGIEASLVGVTYGKLEDVEKACEKIAVEYSVSLQYGIYVTTQETDDIINAIELCTQTINTKKLMDMSSSHSDILVSLIKALQECDSDTEEHVKRTQLMGARLGKRIGLNDTQMSSLSLLCLLHDIGKIGIPLEILNKPGKLTEDEFALIKTHAEKGYQIVMSTREFRVIGDMVLHHHERWDGKGYPSGLSKESIPLLSRIISVVDAYDAIVSDRSYRRGRSHNEAIAELNKNAGTQFDPYIVSEFVQMMGVEDEDNTVVPELAFNNIKKDEQVYNHPILNTHLVNYARYVLSEKMIIIEIDSNFEKMTGYTKEDIEREDINQIDLVPEDDRADYLLLVNEILARHQVAFTEHRLLRKDGKTIFVMCIGRIYYDSVAKEERSEIFVCDTSDTLFAKNYTKQEEQRSMERLQAWQETYRKDSLTGLLVRSAFQNDVEEKLLLNKYKTVFMMIDVDNFKTYNNTYGHDVGDAVLISLARSIVSSVKPIDLVCRMGGDEFAAALFFNDDVSVQTIHRRIAQIYYHIQDMLKQDYQDASISMGVSVSGEGIDTFRKLYKAADTALYESKKAGKKRATYSGEFKKH